MADELLDESQSPLGELLLDEELLDVSELPDELLTKSDEELLSPVELDGVESELLLDETSSPPMADWVVIRLRGSAMFSVPAGTTGVASERDSQRIRFDSSKPARRLSKQNLKSPARRPDETTRTQFGRRLGRHRTPPCPPASPTSA
ncbi:MAG TPA: hypothetical protein VD866_23205 [Urbifossiella sp.]|nr:hypothetical protein [Urbifossiella sp.]